MCAGQITHPRPQSLSAELHSTRSCTTAATRDRTILYCCALNARQVSLLAAITAHHSPDGYEPAADAVSNSALIVSAVALHGSGSGSASERQPCQQMLAVTPGARQNGRLARKEWVARQQLVTGAQLPGSVHPLEAVAPTHRRPSTQVRAAAAVGRGALHMPRARGPSPAPHCAPAARSTPVGTFRASSLSKGPVAPAS
eukprot:COSAG01_NODE_2066_length_8507_cov_3.752141_5_plen_199_part_00